MRAAFLFAALILAACDGRASNAAEEGLTNAQRLVRASGARGQVPPGDYVCFQANPDSTYAQAQPYGSLGVRGETYRLVLMSGQVLSGQIHATPAGQLIWNGPLGPIDLAPRRVARAQVTASEDAVSLVFDFAPALPGPPPTGQVSCMMSVAATI